MSPDRIKSIRNSMLVASLILLAVGIAFIVWPEQAATVLARVVAGILTATGVFELVLFALGKRKGYTDVPAVLTGVVLTVLGVFLIIKPDTMLNFFNILFGIVIIVIGIDHIFQSIFIIRYVRRLWWISLLVGIAALAMGVITILNPFSAVKTAMIIIGITMVIEAIGGIWNLPALKARPEAVVNDAKPVSGDEDINA
ncbi:MAG: DUF308 domain-containing protein [Clostridiales bacterium]|nr:DUF308 domain-containing protein [Clostridiales bacterium]